MFGRTHFVRVAAALALFCCLKVYALIFPLAPAPDGSYDFNFNVLQSYDHLWASNHHAMYNILSQNGVAVAPRWLLTAWHIAQNMDEQWWVNDDHDRYYFQEKVDLGNDLALIRVDKPLPFYSKIQKFAGGAGDILEVYGQSGAPQEPIFDSTGKPVGWKFAPISNHPALRWGRGRRLTTPPTTIQWDFTANDSGLGNGGLNCATVNTNDSGGGIFVQDALAGIITGLVAQGFRYSPDEPITTNCDLNPIGHVFDPSLLYRCSNPFHPFTRAYGASVYGALSNIFAHISPSRRINAGGPIVQAPEGSWDAGTLCGECLSYSDSAAEPISVAGLNAPAPQMVYKTAAYAQGKSLSFTVTEQVKYEKYKIRLHFASIFPADKPGASLESITVNGSSKLFDPYTGPRAASILELTDVSPDQNSEISVSIQPQNPGGYTTISGIEVLLNPLAPPTPPDLKWDTLAAFPTTLATSDVAFGNGAFVASGSQSLFSLDNGGTWQLPDTPFTADGVRFVNGLFFALRGSSMLCSVDGRSWDSRLPYPITSVAYGNDRFVVAMEKMVGVSHDALNWTVIPVEAKFGPIWMSFGNGRFLAGNDKFSYITSIDGTNWTQFKAVLPDPAPGCVTNCSKWQWIDQMLYANGSFVSYGLAFDIPPNFPDFPKEHPPLLISSDGVTWEAADAPLTPYQMGGLSFVNNRLIYLPSRSFTTDLVNWRSFSIPRYPTDAPHTNAWDLQTLAAAYGNSHYVILDALPAIEPVPLPSPIVRGADLDSLERMDHPPRGGCGPRAATAGKTLVVVNPLPGFPLPLLVSTNSGAAFTPADLPPDSRGLLAIVFAKDQWVAVGERGLILHSSDALHWKRSTANTTNDLLNVAYGGGTWVAVGTGGTVLASHDIGNFSLVDSGTSAPLNGACFGTSGFVAVGTGGVIIKSLDGREWTAQQLDDHDLFSVAYGNGTYAAVGTNGFVQIFSDLANWSSSRPTSGTLRDVCYADGMFFTVESANPSIGYLSLDGISWTVTTLPRNILSTSASDDAFLFVHGDGAVEKLRFRPPEITLSAAQSTADGLVVTFDAPVAGNYTVLSSNDLLTWQSELNLTRASSDQLVWRAENKGQKFFRVKLN